MAGKKQKQEGVGAWVAIVIPLRRRPVAHRPGDAAGQTLWKRRAEAEAGPAPLQTAAPEPAAAASRRDCPAGPKGRAQRQRSPRR